MKRSLGSIITILVTLIAVGGGIWYLASREEPAPVSATLWTKGNPESNVSLLEYSDFQCPACKAYQPAVEAVLEEFGDQIRFEYRHFPLPSHRNSKQAAYAAEAAGAQGKFFEMASKIFEKQGEWAESNDAREQFIAIAKELGLDEDKFKQAMDSSTTKDEVDADLAAGKADGVTATPSFFLNGKKLEPPQDIEAFKKIISDELAK